jgi:hypothetical protein
MKGHFLMPNHTADPSHRASKAHTHLSHLYSLGAVPDQRVTDHTAQQLLLAAADPESVIMHVASTPAEDHSGCSTSSESGFEQVVTSLPDIPEKEVIISELDGAVLPFPQRSSFSYAFTLGSAPVNIW